MITDEVLGRWPRRLLHVPTMTSHEWAPGNRYGAHQSPAYNAITYTWGRYRLRDPTISPDIRALTIHGVPWPIPRVTPEHFTREQFHAVVQSAVANKTVLIEDCSSQWSSELDNEDNDDDAEGPIEFLWLDVACIDQRRDQPSAAAEIARQGDIFRGARRVFVWLTTFGEAEDVQALFGALLNVQKWEFGVRFKGWQVAPAAYLKTMHHSLQRLLTDPWFSSLWTLQEAFLRPDAYFLSREGELVACSDAAAVPVGSAWAKALFAWNFNTLVSKCASLARLVEHVLATKEPDEDQRCALQGCLALLRARVDLLQFGDGGNPLIALVASNERTTSREVDRVYGIQQIFGFRLGASAPREVAEAELRGGLTRTFTREELEEELGEALVATFPVLSQIHALIAPVDFGKGWHIGAKSRIWSVIRPGTLPFHVKDNFQFGGYAKEEPINECCITTQQIQNKTWGKVHGKICPLSQLVTKCRLIDQVPLVFSMVFRFDEISTWLRIYPDQSKFLQAYPADIRTTPNTNRASQWNLQDWLCKHDRLQAGEELVVLRLAIFDAKHEMDISLNTGFGLLLLLLHSREEGPDNSLSDMKQTSGSARPWRRLGYCEWGVAAKARATRRLSKPDGYTDEARERDIQEIEGYDSFLRGETENWVEASGLFG